MSQAVLEQAKAKLAKSPEREKPLRAAWNRVCDVLHPHFSAMRPKPKVYEVHHATEVARAAFLAAFCDGKPDEACVAAALARLGIDA